MNTSALITSKLLRVTLAVSFIAGLSWAVTPALTVRAATITVTTTTDENNNDGDCSLREAIIAANTNAAVDACTAGNGADTITLPAGTYTLSLAGTGENAAATGDLDITADVTIDGAGRANTTIDAAGIDRVFEVRSTANAVTFTGVTLAGGDAGANDGGAILVTSSAFTLTTSRLRDNVADGGGGLYISEGALTVLGSRISGNDAVTGGGLYILRTTALILNSVVDGNTVIGNPSASSGGGIRSASAATVTVVNSTISGNSADLHGGGLYSDGTTNLYNVTVANNVADADGDNNGDGGGVGVNSFAGVLNARNSLIGDNTENGGGLAALDCAGTLTSQGYNLIATTSSCTITGDLTGNVTGLSPNLGPLQGNGGNTLTHELLAGSPAIDAGDPAGCVDGNGAPLGVDQRGYARANRCDIGANESNSPGTPTATSTPLPATATFTSVPPTATTTSTQTATRTATPTATRTATPSPTLTASPTRTNTPPPTATRTPTPANTSVPNSTPTSTPTASPTRNCTPGPDNPPCTATPTGTLSATPTVTVTPPPTGTIIVGPTQTPQPTATPFVCTGQCLYLPLIVRQP